MYRASPDSRQEHLLFAAPPQLRVERKLPWRVGWRLPTGLVVEVRRDLLSPNGGPLRRVEPSERSRAKRDGDLNLLIANEVGCLGSGELIDAALVDRARLVPQSAIPRQPTAVGRRTLGLLRHRNQIARSATRRKRHLARTRGNRPRSPGPIASRIAARRYARDIAGYRAGPHGLSHPVPRLSPWTSVLHWMKSWARFPVGARHALASDRWQAQVADAITNKRHLVVQAGTGTGKTLAYLVPAILLGAKVVVATATKALQDQLVGKDLPFLAAHLERPFTYASLKGRANYLCLQRAKEVLGGDEQLAISGVDPLADRAPRSELLRLIEWGTESPTGDRAELVFEPSSQAWAALSVSARECPGATRCPIGEACFAERARAAAAEADVIVVNSYLYGMHLATDGAVLPEHDVVVFDEAHQLEEVISATAGIELSGASFVALARAVKAIVADDRLIADLEATAGQLTDALSAHHGQRIRGLDEVLAAAVEVGQGRVDRALAALRSITSDAGDTANRKLRAIKTASALINELATVAAVPEG